MRLNKFLSANCGVSRREADRLIESGLVRINGEKVTELGVQVSETDNIELDGDPVTLSELEYYRFFKPRGMLTAYGDGRGKETLEEIPYLREKKLAYSGRLDYDSEGLIIFTNDGDLILRLQKSEFKAEKEYLVWVNGDLCEDDLEQIRSGLSTDEMRYLPCGAERIKAGHFRLILTEGKKRQIREIFRFFGLRVSRLLRVRIGNINIDGLRAGELKRLSAKEITELKKCTG
ncbi:pseudouridine synthase [Geovibrio thiophilus]|uniref:pseudouridine synthase n=1 Tax=Geovibrio thiophilus TaxID=139438 RepID=UPI0013E37F8A|nr:pseudouridine synthase [Geovibrio thiophilus]